MTLAGFGAVKLVSQVVGTLGVHSVVAQIVRNNVAVETTAQAVMARAGSLVLAGVAAERGLDYITRTFDGFEQILDKIEFSKNPPQ